MKKITKKDGKLKKQVIHVINNYINSVIIRPDTWTNNGRNLHTVRHTVIEIIDAVKCKHKEGNDAPRGGAEGNYIKISNPALKKINSLLCKQ